jgi:hypothetical protein
MYHELSVWKRLADGRAIRYRHFIHLVTRTYTGGFYQLRGNLVQVRTRPSGRHKTSVPVLTVCDGSTQAGAPPRTYP